MLCTIESHNRQPFHTGVGEEGVGEREKKEKNYFLFKK